MSSRCASGENPLPYAIFLYYPTMHLWLAIKRPLLLAFFLGCTVSFLTSRTLTLRLVLPATAYWSFVPLIEIGALAAVCRRDRQEIMLGNLVDLFFRGYTPWLLWLVGLSAIWCLLSPASKALDAYLSTAWLDDGIVAAALWSLYTDFHFFRSVLRRTRSRALRDVALHRVLSWSLIAAVIAAPTIWSDTTGRLW